MSNNNYYSGASSNFSGNRSHARNKPFYFMNGRRIYIKRESSIISHNKYIAKAEEGETPSIYVSDYKLTDLELADSLKRNLDRKQYLYPTKIQHQSITHILQGRDLLGLAQTGSGKTAAFLIPLIEKVLKDAAQKVLIICPTRELANQIKDELFALTQGMPIRSVLVIGGASAYRQIFLIQKNPQFVIGTPGRIKDLSQRGELKLGQFNNIVLDEVDRMLDMGFVHDIKFLVSKLRGDKQSLFFSATMPSAAEHVARTLLKDPVRVQVEKQSPVSNVDQNVVKADSNSDKLRKLQDLLVREEFKKVLIFSRTKRATDRLSIELRRSGFKVDAIHGSKSQFVRTKVITKFKKDVINVLVATDVAARGLDIPDITHVINFDEPATYEDYIHRIGRTGRVGKKGVALTFVK